MIINLGTYILDSPPQTLMMYLPCDKKWKNIQMDFQVKIQGSNQQDISQGPTMALSILTLFPPLSIPTTDS